MTNRKARKQNEELSYDYYWCFIVHLCSNYVAFNCNGGFMTNYSFKVFDDQGSMIYSGCEGGLALKFEMLGYLVKRFCEGVEL